MIKIGKNLSEWSAYSCRPRTKYELVEIIMNRIYKYGDECDLNDIDVSQITDMSYLFFKSKFNGDISNWNTSKVEDMSCMFAESDFNGNISNWDVSNVTNVINMFNESIFTGDISR